MAIFVNDFIMGKLLSEPTLNCVWRQALLQQVCPYRAQCPCEQGRVIEWCDLAEFGSTQDLRKRTHGCSNDWSAAGKDLQGC